LFQDAKATTLGSRWDLNPSPIRFSMLKSMSPATVNMFLNDFPPIDHSSTKNSSKV